VYPITPNQALLQFAQDLSLTLRHLLMHCAWAVIGALAAMGACYCCGYVAREGWGKVGPPRRPANARQQDAVSREAELGIKQIEEYLWAACSNRGEPPRDGRASDPGTGTAAS
jgi:hypothetical protein